MSASVVTQTKQWLSSFHHINVPHDWLEACIEWIQEENQGRQLNSHTVRTAVYEQWLTSDLRVLESSSLPPGLSQEQKCTLNGSHCLQINSLLDVSTPLYGQYQTVCGTQNDNVNVSATQAEPNTNPWEAKASRMLMLHLTDGTQDIQGMEYQTISALSTSTRPGAKIRVKGPVVSRLGVLILTSQNVEVLGGDVDTLMQENSQLKLLARAIGQEDEVQNVPNRDTNELPDPPHETQRSPTIKQTAQELMDIGDDDEFFNQIDEDDLAAMEEQWEDDLNDDALMQHVDTQEGLSQHANPPQHRKEHHGDISIQSADQCQTLPHKNSSGRLSSSSFKSNQHSNNEPQTSMGEGSWNGSRYSVDRSLTDTRKASCLNQQLGSSNIEMCDDDIDFSAMSDFDVDEESFRNLSSRKSVPSRRTSSTTVQINNLSTDKDRAIDKDDGQPKNKQAKIERKSVGLSDLTFSDFNDDIIDLTDEEPSPPGGKCDNNVAMKKEMGCGRSKNEAPPVLSIDLIRDRISSREAILTQTKIGLDSEPYTYLCLVLKSMPFSEVKRVKVRAYISTLLSKLDHGNFTQWSLGVKLNDGTAVLDVNLSNELLTKVIGFSTSECKLMRQQGKHDIGVRNRMLNGIKKCQEILAHLSCIMELEFSPSVTVPTCVCLHHVTEETLKMMKKRVVIAGSKN